MQKARLMSIDPRFGEEMKRYRKVKNLSQRKLAAIVKLDSGYISRIENGYFKPPSEAKIIAIAEAIGADPDYMLSLSGKVSSDIKSVVQQNPEAMSAIIRKLGEAGSKLELAMSTDSLAEIFFDKDDSEDDRAAKTVKLMKDILDQVRLLSLRRQIEVIPEFETSLIDLNSEIEGKLS